MSGASERANGRASGPVLTSRFLFVPDHSAEQPGRSRPQQQYTPFPDAESISEILDAPFPATSELEAKIAACELYSNTSLVADAPDTDVAMKIIKR